MKFVEVEHPELGTTTVPEVSVKHMEPKGWTVVGEASGPGGNLLFDPGAHTVAEVLEHLEYASVEERDRVLEAERAGQARKTIVG